MAVRQRLRVVKSGKAGRGKGGDSGDGGGTKKGPPRNVQSIEFKPPQWEAVCRAAEVEGHPPGAWVRAAALAKARRMGLWDPLQKPGPKGDAPPETPPDTPPDEDPPEN